MLTALFYYWLIGVLFTCFVLYVFKQQEVYEELYEEFLVECEKDGIDSTLITYGVFEIIGWIVSFIIIPLIYPAILMYWLRK